MAGSRRRALVIGGGLIGTEVALRLRASGREVRVLSRSIGARLRALGPVAGLELVAAEVGAGLALSDAIAGVDEVLCLAGSSTPAIAAADPAGALAGSVLPALGALLAAGEADVRRVVVASSGGTVYGAGAPLPTPEDAPLEPSSLHGVNSLAVEAFVDFFRRERGVEATTLRFSNVYGPGAEPRRGQGVIAAWCRSLALGRPITIIGSDQARRDFVFVGDAADAVEVALEAPAGVYNVGSGRNTSIAELIDHLREGTGITPEIERLPGRDVDVPNTELDITRLHAATGWEPGTGLVEGIAATWRWERRGG